MYFFACVLFAMSVALQAAAIASPRIAHRIHAKRCATSTHVTATGVEHVEPSSSAHQAKPSATGTAANSTTSTSSNSFLSGNQFGQGHFLSSVYNVLLVLIINYQALFTNLVSGHVV